MTEFIIVDSNLLLRIIIGEPEHLVEKAKHLLMKAKKGEVILILLNVILAETIYTLKSYYKIHRKEISSRLLSLLNCYDLQVENYGIVIDSLIRYQNHNIDFEDDYLAAVAYNRKQKVASFEGLFKKVCKRNFCVNPV